MKIRLSIFLLLCCLFLQAQQDSAFFKRVPADTAKQKMNMDAVYNRPFLQAGKLPIALGGYLEANSSYFVTDGISDGLSFQLPRLTLFVSSTLTHRLKFLSEIELEDGGREINIEFASLDVTFHPLLNFRGGVIMNPIGAFNQNHDGPRWEFVARPLSATTIIPATWSNVGFGLFGKYAMRNLVWAYEIYCSNGFDDRIITNTENRTWFPASKANSERFNESFNGVPLITAKTAFRYKKTELGISWMGGVYNKFQIDGIVLDKRRRADMFALDFNTTIKGAKTFITGEWVVAMLDVPRSYTQQYGNRQQGGFVDIVQPVLRRDVLGWKNSVFNLALRLEYVDYNVGVFRETNGNMADDVYSFSPGLSFRPSAQTVFRGNYRYLWQQDLLGNPASRSAGFEFGFSTYF